MGYLTTFTVYNDGCDLITKHPQKFAEIIHDACSNREADSYGLGNFANLITAQGTKHADEHTFYVHSGNTVVEMSMWSNYTKELMKRHPRFFKSMLDEMSDNARELRKQFKEMNNGNTVL